MKIQTRLALAALIPIAAFSQPAATPPIFEMADVHVSPRSLHPVKQGGVLRGNRYELTAATMVDLIAPDKVLGGPHWLEMDRFDVIAKTPPNTPPQDLRLMLQALLAERFQLAVHADQKPMSAYVLTVGNGKPKLKQSEGPAPPGCQRHPEAVEASAIPATCHALTMEALAGLLGGAAGDYLTSPVVNNTQLEGAWDFTVKWTPRNSLIAAGPDGISIFDALEKQLGLKLELKQIPTPVFVIDRANEKPLANPPGVTAALPPPPPPQFDAATIKPTDPAFSGIRFQFTPSVNIAGVTLSFLMQNIWFVAPEMIAGAPKWLNTDRWDIIGKIAAAPGAAPRTDLDSMIVMVRDLLEDRFRLKTHIEDRAIPAWALTASKPKLRKADPANRTRCKEGPEDGEKDLRLTNPGISRLVTCHNMTMTQLAEQLPHIADATSAMCCLYLRSPVLDSTGLEGAYDFTLGFSPQSAVQNNGDPDPNGAVSLFEALNSQLGLKLSLEKRPAPVLVIDHVEQKPLDN